MTVQRELPRELRVAAVDEVVPAASERRQVRDRFRAPLRPDHRKDVIDGNNGPAQSTLNVDRHCGRHDNLRWRSRKERILSHGILVELKIRRLYRAGEKRGLTVSRYVRERVHILRELVEPRRQLRQVSRGNAGALRQTDGIGRDRTDRGGIVAATDLRRVCGDQPVRKVRGPVGADVRARTTPGSQLGRV